MMVVRWLNSTKSCLQLQELRLKKQKDHKMEINWMIQLSNQKFREQAKNKK